MVICSRRNIKAVYPALILVFSVLIGAAQALEEDPNIGKSPEIIDLNNNVFSSFFQIWNNGADPLNYSLSIDGDDAEYFIIDGTIGDVNGQSVNADDQKTHMLSIILDYDPRFDITLNARIVITENNDANLVSYITLRARFHADTSESSSPLIGRSAGYIELAGNVTSKRFSIWNNGTGTMNYTLSIYGDDSGYFSLDTEQGQSEGQSDKQTHTVSVEYDSDFHNDTLYAWIEITDGNNNTGYIDLSATETVATRVSRIAIEQGVNYGYLGVTYDFHLYMETDNTVEEVDFITPEDAERTMGYDENEDGSIRYWFSVDEFDSFDGLGDYGDGTYVITVTYDNDDTAQTEINFGIPNKPGTIVWPTQEPVITYPEEKTASPVRLKWEKCVDPNVGSIRFVLENYEGEYYEEIINSIAKEYRKGTTKSTSINLGVGQWLATLGFGKWYQSKNDDGIPYEVGKCTKGYSDFEIMKWFGTFDEFKNHPFKIADCYGTEVTFNLTGGGWGEITGDECEFESIDLHDTTEKSVFTIKTAKNAEITIGDVTADNDIKTIKAPQVNLDGALDITGGARSITLNNVTGSIDIGEYASDDDSPKMSTCVLKFNQISGLDLTSYTPIRNFRSTEWLYGSLTAPWISAMTIKGDFIADVTVGGDENPKGMALKKASIAGQLTGLWEITGNCSAIKANDISEWDLTVEPEINDDEKPVRAIRNIKSRNWIKDSTITVIETPADIGTITTGAIQNSTISTDGSLKLFKMKGLPAAYCFVNSNIEAKDIGSATLLYTKYNNIIEGKNTPFGLTAASIGKLTIKDMSGKKTWKKLVPGATIEGIPIVDFEVNPP